MRFYKKDEQVIESRRRFLGKLVGLMGVIGIAPSIQLDLLSKIVFKLGYKEALAVGADESSPKVVIELITRAGDAANKFMTCPAALPEFRVAGDNSSDDSGLRAHLWAGPLSDPLQGGPAQLKNLTYTSLGNNTYVPQYEDIVSNLTGVPMAHFLSKASGHSSNLALRRGSSSLPVNALNGADLPNFASLHAATLNKQSITGGKILRWRANTTESGDALTQVLHPLGNAFQNYAQGAGLITEPQIIDLGSDHQADQFRDQFNGDLVIGNLTEAERAVLAESIDDLTAYRLNKLSISNSEQILGYTGGLVDLLGLNLSQELVLDSAESADFDVGADITPFNNSAPYNLGSAFGHIFKSLKFGLAQTFIVERNVGDQHPEDQAANMQNYGWQTRYAEESVNFAKVIGTFWQKCQETPSPFSPDKMLSEDVMIICSSEFGRTLKYDDNANTDGGDTSAIVISENVNPGTYYNYNNAWTNTFHVDPDDPNGNLSSSVGSAMGAERAWKTIASMISSQTANALSNEAPALFLKKV